MKKCVALLGNAKKNYYEDLDEKDVADTEAVAKRFCTKDVIRNFARSTGKHSSIVSIKEKSKNVKLSFHEINNEKSEKEIRSLHKTKAYQKSDIPIRTIKDNADIFAEFLCETVNNAVKTSNFPNNLNLTDKTT